MLATVTVCVCVFVLATKREKREELVSKSRDLPMQVPRSAVDQLVS